MMRIGQAAAASLALAALAHAARADDRQARLSAGEVLVELRDVEGVDVPEARMEGVVDAPPERVWEVIRDCKRYVGVMPRVVAARELSLQDGVQVCEMTIDTPFPLSDLTGVTSAAMTAGPPEWSRRWTLVRGDYTRNAGAWAVRAFGADGRRSLVQYRVLAEPDVAVPGFIQAFAQEHSLPDLMERIRKAAAPAAARAATQPATQAPTPAPAVR